MKDIDKKRIFIIGMVFACALVITLAAFIAFDSNSGYINTEDEIPDNDEKLIKEFRAHHRYSIEELKTLQIKYLGKVDGYNIYFVPYKGTTTEVVGSGGLIIDGYRFPVESRTTIIGIKENQLHTLLKLIHETDIDIEGLYNAMPDIFKSSYLKRLYARQCNLPPHPFILW